jgi:hypothetical protein
MKRTGSKKRRAAPKLAEAQLQQSLVVRKRTVSPAEEPGCDDEGQSIGLDKEDLKFISSALLSGELHVPTPFDEIERDCPQVWRKAVQTFAGKNFEAREWLETRSPALAGQRPYAVAMQIGGERKVLRELRRIARAMNPRNRLGAIKKGDTVVRWLAGPPMELRVTDVTAHRIICGSWEFCRRSGTEIAEELGSGPGRTPSHIEPKGSTTVIV